ncbi:aminopeptidase N [bacterium MnTg02]|nr:aminopeptidase N [bacterium MnTg02]
MKTDTPRPIHLKNYKPSDYLIDTIELDVSLHPEKTRVKSRIKIRPNPLSKATGAPLRLDGQNLSLERVAIGGKKLNKSSYRLTKNGLTIPKVPNRKFTLEITTTCSPEANKSLSGLYRSQGIYCTQCEPQGFRRITYYLDRPDVLAIFKTRLEADKKDVPVLLSNGNLVKSGALKGGKRHYAVWHDPHPKPAYLFALVGGKLTCVRDKFTTKSRRKVDLRIYVEPGKQDRCAWAMDSLKRAMQWDEKRFGREYDLDIFMIVAVSDFNMGAMENKGLNIFNDKLILARPDTASDNDYASIEAVIAHEYFHNWTGNRITCRDWFQLCLKEGLTVFRDQEFTADTRERTVERIRSVRALKTQQFPEDNGPLAHPVRPASYIEINNFYTATVYEKGAELCRMIQTFVGRKGFRKGMDLYFERHDGEAATVEDFIGAMADANRIDLGQFMLWYEQAGTPELVCSLSYNRQKREACLSIEQICPPTPAQPKKKPVHLPLRCGLLSANGQDIDLVLDNGEPVRDGVLDIRRRTQTFTFQNVPSKPVPSLLRTFSAPVRLTLSLSDHDLEFLMANDSDPFNRWQASQSYATRIIIQMTEAIRQGKTSRKGAPFVKALGATLCDPTLDPAYKAEFLKLPSESDIAREIGTNVDPEAIHNARESLRSRVGHELHDLLVELYDTNAVKGRYSPNAKQAGQRALRTVSLALLAAAGTEPDFERLVRHYWRAKNMTDQMGALLILTHLQIPERETIFQDFYDRWQDDHLVLDKWFALQAISSLSETLDVVKKLKEHPRFSMKTPNKVRAVIGTFASSNPLHFNRADGQGYDFVAKSILELDGFNPQIAARITAVFKSWRMLGPKRQRQAKKALKSIASHKGLSKDTYEIVTKTLG